MENHHDIDQLFSEESSKTEENTPFPAFEKVWGNIEHRLDQKEKSTKIFKIGLPYAIAASLALIFGSLYVFNFQKDTAIKPQISKNNSAKNLETSQEISIENNVVSAENMEKMNQIIKENIKKTPIYSAQVITKEYAKNTASKTNFAENENFKTTEIVPEISEKSPLILAEQKLEDISKDKNINEVVVTAFGTKIRNQSLGFENNKMQSEMLSKVADSSLNTGYLAENNFSSSTEPLYIIDGYIADSDFIKNYNVKKITSLNIIEGRSAVKLYGSYGKKGVVVITTKGLSPNEEQKLIDNSKKYNLQN